MNDLANLAFDALNIDDLLAPFDPNGVMRLYIADENRLLPSGILTIEIQAPIPEPSSVWLFLIAAMILTIQYPFAKFKQVHAPE